MKLNYTTCCMTGGKRRNEDAIFAHIYNDNDKALFVVCDGMSGLRIGDEASKAVVDVFESVLHNPPHTRSLSGAYSKPQ